MDKTHKSSPVNSFNHFETPVIEKFPHPSDGHLLHTVPGSRAHCLGANTSDPPPSWDLSLHSANFTTPLRLHPTTSEEGSKPRRREQRCARELRNVCETSRKRPTRRGSADRDHLARRQRDKHFQTWRSPRRTREQQQRAAPAVRVPAARQWHLITSALPPLHHLDRLPGHFWLCWSNLASRRSHAARSICTSREETSPRRSFKRDWWLSDSARNHSMAFLERGEDGKQAPFSLLVFLEFIICDIFASVKSPVWEWRLLFHCLKLLLHPRRTTALRARLIQQLSCSSDSCQEWDDCQIPRNVDKVEVNLSGAGNKAVCHSFVSKMSCAGGGTLFSETKIKNPTLFRLNSDWNSEHFHVYDCVKSTLPCKIDSNGQIRTHCT